MKKRFYYESKTGIGRSEGFEKKGLAKYTVNIGNICEFGCTFCYVPSVTIKQQSVKAIVDRGYEINTFSSYRKRENVLSTVMADLAKIPPEEEETVFLCSTCDPCGNEEDTRTSAEVIRLIMTRSNLKVRVLSKSTLISDLAELLAEYRERIIYSLSTGTSLPEISKAIESNASPIEQRVQTLQKLQDRGFRTYGMICPVIPSEISRVKELINQVRPEFCEGVWVEALNVRGKSLVLTYDRLIEFGLEDHALEMKRIMGNREAWLEYSKNLFLAFQSEMSSRGQLPKLHFLQYVSLSDREFFENQPGAICL